MKIILSWMRRAYASRAGTFLIVAMFVAGMLGCGGAATYDLTIASTGPGLVTTPGQGTFTYNATAVVSLVATPDTGSQFVRWTGNVSTIADSNAAATTITMNDRYSITANFQYIPMVSAGDFHTLGLTSNRTVVAVGDNTGGQCDVGVWTGIVQIDGGGYHTVGLRFDGTVVAVGNNAFGQSDVGIWTDITQVAAT